MQESVVKIRKDKQEDFIDDICKLWIEKAKGNNDFFALCDPYAVVTMKQDLKIEDTYNNITYNLEKGDILLYISGERSAQRDPFSLSADFHFLYDKYSDMDIIFTSLFGEHSTNFFDERIYKDGKYETDLITMITIDKHIQNRYGIDIEETKKETEEVKFSNIKNDYRVILKKLKSENDFDSSNLKIISGSYESFEAYPSYMWQQSVEQTYDAYQKLEDGNFLLTHNEYHCDQNSDYYIETKGIIGERDLEVIAKYWDKVLDKNEQWFEDELIVYSESKVNI